MKSETPQQEKAFELYYEMGEKRSIKDLAQETGIPVGTLMKWQKELKWNERIEKRNQAVTHKIREANLATVPQVIETLKKAILVILTKEVFQPLQYGETPFKIRNVKEFKEFVNLYLELNGGLDKKLMDEINREYDENVISMIQEDDEIWKALNEKVAKNDKE